MWCFTHNHACKVHDKKKACEVFLSTLTPRRLQSISSTVNEITTCNKLREFVKKKILASPIYQSATRLKKKVSRIATQFSCRLELLGGMTLRTSCLLAPGLELVDILQISVEMIFPMQLQNDNQIERPSEHFFLNCLAGGSNSMNSATARTSQLCKSDLLVPSCSSLHTLLHSIHVLLAVDGTADPSRTCLYFL